MPYHEITFKNFIHKNLQPQEKVYLLGGNDKLAEIYIVPGILFFDYRLVVKSYVQLWCIFEDEEGDEYRLICLLNGTHTVNYNSEAPNITKLTVKGDALEKYHDLRISIHDVM